MLEAAILHATGDAREAPEVLGPRGDPGILVGSFLRAGDESEDGWIRRPRPGTKHRKGEHSEQTAANPVSVQSKRGCRQRKPINSHSNGSPRLPGMPKRRSVDVRSCAHRLQR